MFNITDAAGTKLATILEEQSCPEEMAIRLVQDNQGLALSIDTQKPGDQTYDHDGRTILLIDESTQELLGGTTLDVEESDDGGRLCLTQAGA